MVHPKLPAVALAGALSLLTLSSCTSSSKPAGSGSTTTAPAAQASSSPTVASTSPGSTVTGSTPGTTLFSPGAMPTVNGASDLSKEPKVAAGTGSPPAKLTGKDLVVGTGAAAGPNATVTVQYVGALWTGKVFDASWTDSGPATFQLSGVIAGFKDAIIGMKVGGRREIVIPPAQGYGASGQPPVIPANSTLVFVIDLLQVQQQ